MIGLNVFSGFDGHSCAQVALEMAGIKVNKYYASEIDPYALKVSRANWPDSIHMGDFTKWREWDLDWSIIDLFIAGSPCQGFSFAGKQRGTRAIIEGVEVIVSTREMYLNAKHRGADFLSESHLFWEFVLCLDHAKLKNPEINFMLENVNMSKNNRDMISEALGVLPILIDSRNTSPMTRKRNWWANWKIDQPEENNNLMIKDIMESESDNFVFMSDKFVNRQKGRKCLVDNFDRKASSFSAMEYVKNGRQGDYLKCKEGYRKYTPVEAARLFNLPDNYTVGVSNTQRYKMTGNGWEVKSAAHNFKCMIKYS